MDPIGEWRETGSVAVVDGLGVATLLAHVYRLAVHDLPLLAVASGVLLPMAVSATLVGCAVWLHQSSLGAFSTRVAAWSVVVATVLLALSGANVVFQVAAGGTIQAVSLVLLNQGSVVELTLPWTDSPAGGSADEPTAQPVDERGGAADG